MTDNEIIKALECCLESKSIGDCKRLKCPMHTKDGCKNAEESEYVEKFYERMIIYALLVIDNLKAENEILAKQFDELSKVCDKLHAECFSQKKEIERLKREQHHFADIGKMYTEIKAEAIKEFAERLKQIYTNDERYNRPNAHTLILKLFDNIDNLVKEMEGK